LDTILESDGTVSFSAGGPPCYAGLTSRKFGFEVALATRVGRDFPEDVCRFLENEKLIVQQRQIVDSPTTRFGISGSNNSRSLTLLAKCSELQPSDIDGMKVDCWLVSPVFDEVPPDVLRAVKSNPGSKNFVMLDPQGYMRSADRDGNIAMASKIDLDLAGIGAIKVDEQEMSALTGGLTGLVGMRALQSRGIEFVVATVSNEIHLLYKNTQYWAKIKEIDTPDSTGAGDILSGAFCCSYIKERDPLWALCFSAGAVRAALETGGKGLSKIPSFSKIEENASYFYNTIGFKQFS
jgi:sugar/nucleoside kinase (ribokinase family)